MQQPSFHFEFTRNDIENKNVDECVRLLSRISDDGQQSWELMHKVFISVGGYDLDPRGLGRIPAVRTFFLELNKMWPYFLFFCMPKAELFGWWFSLDYFPIVGAEDGTGTFMKVTVEGYERAMGDFFDSANYLQRKFNFPLDEYLKRQSEMVTAINLWALGRDF